MAEPYEFTNRRTGEVKQYTDADVAAYYDKKVELLAAYAHEAWSGWMVYMFNKGKINNDGTYTMPADLQERWARQMATRYADLPESEKESDRAEAHKIFRAIGWEE